MSINITHSLKELIKGDLTYTDESAASPQYFMFVSRNSWWYIMRLSVNAGITTIDYAVGESGPDTNWTNRASLTYSIVNDLTI